MPDFPPQVPEFNLLTPPPEYTPEKLPKRRGNFLLVTLFLIIILIVGGISYRRYSIAELPNDGSAYDPITLKPKTIGFLQTVKNLIFHSNNFLEGQSDDRVNILLLGMGGPGHDGPYLTDTNIIISLKPSVNKAAMISVPRDTGVAMKGQIRKINFANALGEAEQAGNGGEYARQLFSSTFDLDIPYYVRMDFQAFEEIIDAVAGVNIDVPAGFTDTEFPGPKDSYQTITFDKGLQVMLGVRALQFARSRHGNNGEGSDFARARRQQLILTALKQKLLSIGTYVNPLKIEAIWQSLSNHVTTNLSFGQLMYLASMARDLNGGLTTLVLDNTDEGYLMNANSPGAGFTLLPKTGNFNQVNTTIKNIFSPNDPNATATVNATTVTPGNHNPSIFPAANIEIQNGTWHVGLASIWENILSEQGFSVNKIGNTIKRPLTVSAIYLPKGAANQTALIDLGKIFSAKVATALPDWLTPSYDNPATQESEIGLKYQADTDILIILGEDAKK
ncbi:MAG: LCP family protein [bacterium]|nr:LCP family protein [bacterium]